MGILLQIIILCTLIGTAVASGNKVAQWVLLAVAALCALANRSEATLLDWIRNRDFPAVKVDEEWTADRNQVVDWLKNRLNA